MTIERIIEKFEQIEQNIHLIKENIPNNEDDFVKLGIIKDGIYKRYEFSVELIIDIISMVNSHFHLGIPKNTLDIILNLERKKVISLQCVEIIKGMKAFRNVLVHIYEKLDDRLAFNNIINHIDDFGHVKEEIISFLQK
ncbi:type VII toxin-antitoxin system HepT family RNase toxin [Candidatus Lokiarchaeum ossiferum]|uniref:type VII toxin-antitoxin system HepT family RNase toxin n=1 Tax=Candidatus Lokiarchaeum ossiferum TaxID=2951803 RepID=UPI00352C6AD1